MMLQLVQSPSLRTQRLIKELCNEDKVNVESPDQDGNLIRATSSPSRPDKQNKKSAYEDKDDKLTETKLGSLLAQKNKNEASNDQGTSESHVDEINSFVGSYSSTSDRKPASVTKVSRVVDEGDSFAIASSSLSSFPSSLRNRNESDENVDNFEEDNDDVREDGRNDRVIDGNEDYESQ